MTIWLETCDNLKMNRHLDSLLGVLWVGVDILTGSNAKTASTKRAPTAGGSVRTTSGRDSNTNVCVHPKASSGIR
jgi:hypothetical protein